MSSNWIRGFLTGIGIGVSLGFIGFYLSTQMGAPKQAEGNTSFSTYDIRRDEEGRLTGIDVARNINKSESPQTKT